MAPRSRLPESIWPAAAEMAKRYGLHRTTKALRLDYAGIKEAYACDRAVGRRTTGPLCGTVGARRREPGRVRGGMGIGAWPNARGHERRDAGLGEPAARLAGELSNDPDHATDARVGRGRSHRRTEKVLSTRCTKESTRWPHCAASGFRPIQFLGVYSSSARVACLRSRSCVMTAGKKAVIQRPVPVGAARGRIKNARSASGAATAGGGQPGNRGSAGVAKSELNKMLGFWL